MAPPTEEAKPAASAPAEEAKAAEPEVVPPSAEEAKPATEAPADETKAADPEVPVAGSNAEADNAHVRRVPIWSISIL